MNSAGTLKGSSSWQLCGSTVICLVLLQVFLQSLSVAVTYVYFTNEMKQLQSKYLNSGVACFFTEDEDSWDLWDPEVGSSPCHLARRQLQRRIQKMISKTFEETISPAQEKRLSLLSPSENGRPMRVAAHITGIYRRSSLLVAAGSKEGQALGQKIQTWESSRKGNSFLHTLHLRNGELVIQKGGLYYIYSQTYFRFQESQGASEIGPRKNKQMVQYIYKHTNYPDPILLMKSARSSCWSKDSEYGLYSIYQGGVFELREEDRLFVSVTNKDLIDLDQEASFFGAFLIA